MTKLMSNQKEEQVRKSFKVWLNANNNWKIEQSIVNKLEKKTSEHPFHLVDPSPWPFLSATSVFILILGIIMYFHGWENGSHFLNKGLIFLIYSLTCWWRDVTTESTYEGQHTQSVQDGIKMGMGLFIVSEIMFFFAFFWSFFYYSVAPVIWIGAVWPPANIPVPYPWDIPYLNTQILLFSGMSLTWAHYAILANKRLESVNALVITIVAGLFFIGFQVFEYIEANFSIASSVYGSIFFLMTGFHGFHVFIGLIFIIICFIRQIWGHFKNTHHVGFEAASWYWHFVDVVWIGLFLSVYWWGDFAC